MPIEALKRLPLDHRAGYLLSRMDGMVDLETLVAIAALPRSEVLRMVRDLVDSGVVAFR
jgi:DNA-binding IclR family transcriptional regulator